MLDRTHINQHLAQSTVRQLVRIMTDDVPSTSPWNRHGYKQRLYTNFAEPIILRKLRNGGPMHEYGLVKVSQLHRTQITRGLRPLVKKKAIKVVEQTRWRTGKERKTYALSSIGELFLVYENRERIRNQFLLEALQNCASEVGSTVLENIIISISKVEDEKRKREYVMALLDLAVEFHGRLYDVDSHWGLVCEFLNRTWRDKTDIAAYVGHFSEECRFLLQRAGEALTRAANQVDFLLAHRGLSNYP